jgi:hypothetical protein
MARARVTLTISWAQRVEASKAAGKIADFIVCMEIPDVHIQSCYRQKDVAL